MHTFFVNRNIWIHVSFVWYCKFVLVLVGAFWSWFKVCIFGFCFYFYFILIPCRQCISFCWKGVYWFLFRLCSVCWLSFFGEVFMKVIGFVFVERSIWIVILSICCLWIWFWGKILIKYLIISVVINNTFDLNYIKALLIVSILEK